MDHSSHTMSSGTMDDDSSGNHADHLHHEMADEKEESNASTDHSGHSEHSSSNMDHSGHTMDHSEHGDSTTHESDSVDSDHSDHSTESQHMMPMFFWVGTNVTYVIHGLESKDGSSYAFGWFGTLVFGIIVEVFIFSRTYLLKRF